VEDKLSGVTGLEIVLTGTERDSLKDPVRLAQIKDCRPGWNGNPKSTAPSRWLM